MKNAKQPNADGVAPKETPKVPKAKAKTKGKANKASKWDAFFNLDHHWNQWYVNYLGYMRAYLHVETG